MSFIAEKGTTHIIFALTAPVKIVSRNVYDVTLCRLHYVRHIWQRIWDILQCHVRMVGKKCTRLSLNSFTFEYIVGLSIIFW